ncbi:hypothetical protein [Natrinema salinisoli]|uniref:hypothetical protein n=1 Tax=Natrinema salinisoli TaxID=2878535 RepID=UPI001CF0CDB6|nr:hypothetical protein [Natrinema salinisoli]
MNEAIPYRISSIVCGGVLAYQGFRSAGLGLRLVVDEFETLVCPVDDGAYSQITFTILVAAVRWVGYAVGLEPAPPSSSTSSTAGVGTE